MNFPFKTPLVLIFIVLILIACTGQSKKDASDFFLKGNVALTQNNYTEAIRLYDEAIAKNADFSDAYLNKGICLMKINQVEEAYEILTEAIRIDPTLVQAILVRSEAGISLRKLNESEEDLKQIQKDYKDSSRYFLIHGNLMEAKSQTAAALADYDQAIKLDRTNIEALVNRGAIQYKLGSFNLASDDFSDALFLNPLQSEALNNLGLLAIKKKDWEKAISYFDKILSLNPADPLALNNKGYALLGKRELPEAKNLIEKSLDIKPSNGYALRNLGIYYQYAGQPDKAVIQFNKAIELADPVDELYGLAGKAYFSSNDKLTACKIWKQGIILKDSVSIAEYSKNCN